MADKRVVVLLHGIRDYALWHNSLRIELESSGFIVELTNYDRFDLFRFLSPFDRFRRQAIEKVWRQIEQIYEKHGDDDVSFIAHSFGTYVLSRILREKLRFRANRIIFCGSVVPFDFPFEDSISKFSSPILNEVGTEDIWPAMAQSITKGYGSAGTYGFRRPNVCDRWHPKAGHGYFLNREFCRRFWLPFLDSGKIVDGEKKPDEVALWVKAVTFLRLKYWIAASLAVALTFFGIWISADQSVGQWNNAVRVAQKAKTIDPSKPMSADLASARAGFESWWRNAGLEARRKYPEDELYFALSSNGKLYRMYEKVDELKPNATYWTEQCQEYFEQVQSTNFVTECLLDRAALYLELSDLYHTAPTKFKVIAESGDAVMTRVATLENSRQKPEGLRLASRFYYNLARPADGLLSSAWNNNYLMLAVSSAEQAYGLAPRNIKNMTQLCRAVQKASANPVQENDPKWTTKLRAAQIGLLSLYREQRNSLTTPEAIIPPSDILAVITMDVVRREIADNKLENDHVKLNEKLLELEEVAIPTLVETWALVKHMPQAKSYQFDINYDLGRIRSLAFLILSTVNDQKARAMFEQAKLDFAQAAENASAVQLKAALQSIGAEPTLAALGVQRMDEIRSIFDLK